MRIRSKINMRFWSWKNFETVFSNVYRVSSPRKITNLSTIGPLP